MRGRWNWAFAIVTALACTDDSTDSQDTQSQFACPEGAPEADAPCERANATCTYMSCDEFGVATATCRDDLRWDIATSECGEIFCEQETCAPGFICVRTVAGFPSGTCVENTCEGGPIGCECPGCPEGQSCSSQGTTIECNACNADVCP